MIIFQILPKMDHELGIAVYKYGPRLQAMARKQAPRHHHLSPVTKTGGPRPRLCFRKQGPTNHGASRHRRTQHRLVLQRALLARHAQALRAGDAKQQQSPGLVRAQETGSEKACKKTE